MKPQTNRTARLPGVNDEGSRFPGKSDPLQTRFCFFCFFLFFFYLDRSVERWGGPRNSERSCQRQRKNSRKKWKKKTGNVPRSKITNHHKALKLLFQAIVDIFLSGLVLALRKETSFLTSCMANFGLTAASLFEIPLFRDDFLRRNEMLASFIVKGLKPV